MKPEHYRPTGRSTEVEYVPTIRACTGTADKPGCGGALARPHATSSYFSCTCPEGAHYRWHCFGPDCADVVTVDPPCELGGPEPVVLAGDYFGG